MVISEEVGMFRKAIDFGCVLFEFFLLVIS